MAKVKNALDSLAERITAAHEAAEAGTANSVRHAVKAGKLLEEAKELLPHGDWSAWLERNFPASRRTAQVYMSLARDPAKAQRAALSIRAATEAKPREEQTPASRAVASIRRAAKDVDHLNEEKIWQPGETELKALGDAKRSLKATLLALEHYLDHSIHDQFQVQVEKTAQAVKTVAVKQLPMARRPLNAPRAVLVKAGA